MLYLTEAVITQPLLHEIDADVRSGVNRARGPGAAARPTRRVSWTCAQVTAGVVSAPLVIRTRYGYIGAVVASPSIACTGGAMSYARQMLDTYPRTLNADAGMLAAAIDALSDCAQACNADNAADLGEPDVTEMVRCIRLCLDCVDVCTATAWVISRQAEYDASLTRPLLEACVAICKSCGDECERHAHMPHCRVCAQACRRCEQACRELLDALR
jgi:hypothetical protein